MDMEENREEQSQLEFYYLIVTEDLWKKLYAWFCVKKEANIMDHGEREANAMNE